jgi:hypothetical protein
VPAVATGLFAALLYRSFRGPRGFAGEPQFTRQGLAQQQAGRDGEGPDRPSLAPAMGPDEERPTADQQDAGDPGA